MRRRQAGEVGDNRHCVNTGFGRSAQSGMLMLMNISHNGDLKSNAPASSSDAVEALVESTEVPLAAVDLPSGRFLAVNPPLADMVGSTVGALTGSSSLAWLSSDDRQAAQLGFQALADGDLTGYQAIRRLTNPKDPDQEF